MHEGPGAARPDSMIRARRGSDSDRPDARPPAGPRGRRHAWRARAAVLVGLGALGAGCDVAEPAVPAALLAVHGDRQTGTVAAPLGEPLVVTVTDAAGETLSGVEVTWTVDGAAGVITPASGVTDVRGQASAHWTLGPAAGEQTVAASSAGLERVNFSALAQPGPPAAIAVAPDTARLHPGDTTRLAAVVTDEHGNALEEPALVWTSADTAVARVDSAGLVRAAGTGRVTVRADAGGAVEDSTTVEVASVTPVVEVAPRSIFALTGDTIPLSVVDELGDAIDLAGVTWTTTDSAVARIEPGARLVALTRGSARIVVMADGAGDTIRVSVYPGSGTRVPELAHYDSIVPAFMDSVGLVGGAVAVARDGRLLMARGYGYADSASARRATPESLFRTGSVSKPVAALTALRLAEQGRLQLDTSAFAMVADLAPDPLPDVDPRLADIRVRDLLRHTAGWDQFTTFDAAYSTREIARSMGIPAPADADDLVRYMWGQPLQFDPGTEFRYSCFGFILLARVIERAAGMPFEAAVRSVVLDPVGASGMRLGRTLRSDRAPGEVTYYNPTLVRSVFPPHDLVQAPYGTFHLEAMDGCAGWIASALDLVRIGSAVDGTDAGIPDLLSPATMSAMVARPEVSTWEDTGYYYGLGWWVQPYQGRTTWWHRGSLEGSSAMLVRAHSGVVWAAVFNGSVPPGKVNVMLWNAYQLTGDWPDHDLFDLYP